MFLTRFRKNIQQEGYPFSVPAVQQMQELSFTAPITVLSGENGSGKSTLLQLMAACCGCVRIGDGKIEDDAGIAAQKAAHCFTPVFMRKPMRSFFFSAESFIRYISWIEKSKAEAKEAIAEIDRTYKSKSAAALARQPHEATLADLEELYAYSLSQSSHGEGFLAFFDSRLNGKGLYFIDEPEGALSYSNQYLLAVMVHNAAKYGSQFVIATHSPILCAIPNADIWEIGENGITEKSYDELENISFLRMFMKRKDTMFDE